MTVVICGGKIYLMKQKSGLFVTLFCISLSLSSCGSDNNQPIDKGTPFEAVIENEITSKGYDITFYYKDDFFYKSASIFNKDLAVLSLSLACNNNQHQVQSYVEKIGLDNIYYSPEYHQEAEGKEAFMLAHKQFDDFDLIVISPRGSCYSLGWSGNFKVGLSGDHEDFDSASNYILEGLQEYMNNYSENPIKYWVTGYSRGAAIANSFAGKLLQDSKLNANEDNTYVYTFETPRTVDINNRVDYKNVFNFINKSDIVTHLPPEAHGFARHGQDIYLSSIRAEALAKKIDSTISLTPFKSSGNYATEDQYIRYIFSLLSKNEDEGIAINTREAYYYNHQENVVYLINLLMNLKSSTFNKIGEGLSEMQSYEYITFLGEDALYNFLIPYLDEDGLKYDKDVFKERINKFVKSLKGLAGNVFLELAGSYKNFYRMIEMHASIITYVLINNL